MCGSPIAHPRRSGQAALDVQGMVAAVGAAGSDGQQPPRRLFHGKGLEGGQFFSVGRKEGVLFPLKQLPEQAVVEINQGFIGLLSDRILLAT